MVALTVAIFPWVFERSPKPVNDDIVIEIPRKDGAKPLAMPSGASASAQAAGNATTPGASAPEPDSNALPPSPLTRIIAAAPGSLPDPALRSASATPVIPSVATDGSRSPLAAVIAGGAVAAGTAAVVAARAASKPALAASKPALAASKPALAASKPTLAASKPALAASKPAVAASKPSVAAAPSAAGAAAPAAADKPGRFIVQVAAFSEAAKAREVRLKLEAAGYKTYSQAIDTPKGKVWRVRVGPVDSRAKADVLKAKIVERGFAPAVIEL